MKEGNVYVYTIETESQVWCIDPILKEVIDRLPNNVTLILTQREFDTDVFMCSTVPEPHKDERFHCGRILHTVSQGKGGGHSHRGGSVRGKTPLATYVGNLQQMAQEKMTELGL